MCALRSCGVGFRAVAMVCAPVCVRATFRHAVERKRSQFLNGAVHVGSCLQGVMRRATAQDRACQNFGMAS
eukprot:13289958-Alexandrium_andersonii.AAC.1